jgi:hypothetical protein
MAMTLRPKHRSFRFDDEAESRCISGRKVWLYRGMETTHRTPVLTRSSRELAVFVSLCSTTLGLALSWFAHVPELPIVIGAIAASTAVGFAHAGAPQRPIEQPLQLVG